MLGDALDQVQLLVDDMWVAAEQMDKAMLKGELMSASLFPDSFQGVVEFDKFVSAVTEMKGKLKHFKRTLASIAGAGVPGPPGPRGAAGAAGHGPGWPRAAHQQPATTSLGEGILAVNGLRPNPVGSVG